jgi:hypothetical protein
MSTGRSETISAHSVTSTGQEPNVRKTDVDQSSNETSGQTIPPGRRSEARVDYQCLCSYEVLDARGEESAVIEQGTAIQLNQSPTGMLLFMRQAPHVEQLIEVQSPRYESGLTANIFDVQWTKPVHVESFGSLYLVGCRRIFVPSHHLSV